MLLSPRSGLPVGLMGVWNSPAIGLLGIGSYLATSIVGLTLVGHWLDGRFGTEPVLTLVFLVLGLLVGFYGAYQQLRDLIRRQPKPPGGGSK